MSRKTANLRAECSEWGKKQPASEILITRPKINTINFCLAFRFIEEIFSHIYENFQLKISMRLKARKVFKILKTQLNGLIKSLKSVKMIALQKLYKTRPTSP